MADIANTWEKIRQGLKEAEHLFSQKQYNLSMIKCRQTLEYMVKSLGERACIVDGDLSETIDQLYEGQWISKTTKEHYHRLRIIGNKAVHEENNNPFDANLACQILSQEASTFSDEYNPRQRRSASSSSSRSRNSSAPRRKRPKKRKSSFKDALRIFIPIICVILLILIIRVIVPKTEKEPNTTTSPTDTSAPSEPVTMESENPSSESPLETSTASGDTQVPETTEMVTETYRTTSTLNIRAEPSTTSRILSQLEPGIQVTVIGVYDEQWSIILYNGQNAYVATAYLTR